MRDTNIQEEMDHQVSLHPKSVILYVIYIVFGGMCKCWGGCVKPGREKHFIQHLRQKGLKAIQGANNILLDCGRG